MSARKDPNKELLRSDLLSRVRKALELRDWKLLEHWARQWIQLDSQNSQGFRWLARAAMALNKMPRAAYAYGRVLDFEPNNEEALRFFKEFPSVGKNDSKEDSTEGSLPIKARVSEGSNLTLKQKQGLSRAEFELAKNYFELRILDRASEHFLRSFGWYPNKQSAIEGARALHQFGRSLDAIEFLSSQLSHEPNWLEGRMLLGRIFFEIGKKMEAQREWQLVLSQEPSNVEALNMLRSIYLSK